MKNISFKSDTMITSKDNKNTMTTATTPLIISDRDDDDILSSKSSSVYGGTSRETFKVSYPLLYQCFCFHALDADCASFGYTMFVVVCLLSCYIFQFPPAERFIIYVSDSIYIIEWFVARKYISNSTHFFDRAMVAARFQIPNENHIYASLAITAVTVVIEKTVWFVENGLSSSQPGSFSWFLQIFASVGFVWRLHGLFVVAIIINTVITSHMLEVESYTNRIRHKFVTFNTEEERTGAIREHAQLSVQLNKTSILMSSTMGVSIGLSLLSIILIMWYVVSGAAPTSLLLSVFDYIINYFLSLICLLRGASLISLCREPYKVVLELVANGGTDWRLSSMETIFVLQHFKENSEVLKVFGIVLSRSEIARSMYLFVTVVAVILLQVMPLEK
jgi:hypothetical protein